MFLQKIQWFPFKERSCSTCMKKSFLLKESSSSQRESAEAKLTCNHMNVSIVSIGRTRSKTEKIFSINLEEKFLPVLVKSFSVDIHFTKKWSILLRIFSVNVTKSAVSLLENFIFVLNYHFRKVPTDWLPRTHCL